MNALPRITAPMSTYDFLMGPMIATIQEEPRRIHMRHWRATLKKDPARFQKLVGISSAPSCGVIGCLAGWTTILTGYDDLNEQNEVQYAARDILGIEWLARDLFEPMELIDDRWQGTRGHAERVVGHIRTFCRRNEEKLRSLTVIPQGWTSPAAVDVKA